MSFRFILLIVMLVAGTPAFAATVYIRDTLYVPLRGGQSSEYRILHNGIRSGTPLELLEENEESGYSRVRLEDGMEGWIQTQYLVKEPIARDLLEAARAELAGFEAKHQKALTQIQALQSSRDELTANLKQTQTALEAAQAELNNISDLSANVIQIDEQNQELISERAALESQINDLLSANDSLADAAAQEWFVRGGAVVLVSLLLGVWAGRRIYNRRSSGWA